MSSQLHVDTLVDKAGSGGSNVKMANTSTYVGEGGSGTQNTVQGLAKSWVNFNGGGTSAGATITPRDSFNNASITDNGTGDYTVTITSAMANVNYAHVGTAGQGNTALSALCQCFDLANPTTTASRYQSPDVNGVLLEASNVHPGVLGDLA